LRRTVIPAASEGLGDGVGADGDGRGCRRDPRGAHACHPAQGLDALGGERGVQRAVDLPDGPCAHRPRQNTSATSTSPEALQRSVAAA
jgi:hypothetical protein